MSDLRAKLANLKAVKTSKNVNDFFSALVDEIELLKLSKQDAPPVLIPDETSNKERV